MAQNRDVNPKAFFGELLQHDLREVASCDAFTFCIGDGTSKEKFDKELSRNRHPYDLGLELT